MLSVKGVPVIRNPNENHNLGLPRGVLQPHSGIISEVWQRLRVPNLNYQRGPSIDEDSRSGFYCRVALFASPSGDAGLRRFKANNS